MHSCFISGNQAAWFYNNYLSIHPQARSDGPGLLFHEKCTQEFKTCYRLWIGPLKPLVVLCHPKSVKVIQSSNAPKQKLVYSFLRPFIGELQLIRVKFSYKGCHHHHHHHQYRVNANYAAWMDKSNHVMDLVIPWTGQPFTTAECGNSRQVDS